MAMRRPKKLYRPTGAASSSADRLGPGMETVALKFVPNEGSTCSDSGAKSVDALSTEKPATAGVSGVPHATVAKLASTPWFITWEVGVGASVDRGLRLAKVQRFAADDKARRKLLSEQYVAAPREGILTELVVPTGGRVHTLQDGSSRDMTSQESNSAEPHEAVVIGRLSFCTHPELHGTLCTSCGRNVAPAVARRNGEGDGMSGEGEGEVSGVQGEGEGSEDGGVMMSKVTMKGGGTLSVSSTAARKMHFDKSGRLLSSKRLSLVLDLDNTLLHCSDHPDAGRVFVPGVDGIHTLRLPNQPRDYFIKLRPGLRRFLAQAATMFEMTIYTAGTSQYADAVASVLDPDRSLFQGRHYSTCYTPDLGRNTKSLERIFPCGLDMALIVDDRDDVWRGEQAKNLLLVRPYKFFVGQRSVPGGPTHDTGTTDSRKASLPNSSARSSSVTSGSSGTGGDENETDKGATRLGQSEDSDEQRGQSDSDSVQASQKSSEAAQPSASSRDRETERTGDSEMTGRERQTTLSTESKGPSDTLGKLGKGLAKLLVNQGLAVQVTTNGEIKATNGSVVSAAKSLTNSDQRTAQTVSTTSHAGNRPKRPPGSDGGKEEKGASKRAAEAEATRNAKGPRATTMPAPPMSPPKMVASAENDPQLDCIFKTLEAVHGAFYAPGYNHGKPRDVATFLAKVRSRVLRGVRMVFSGVIPVSGAPADPRTHRLWKLAESHGATVESTIERHTTHVVAARLGTAKTNTGLRMPGVFVVHLDWLMNTVWHCRRERETLFLLAGQICEGSPPPLPAPLPPSPTTPSSTSPPPFDDAAKSSRKRGREDNDETAQQGAAGSWDERSVREEGGARLSRNSSLNSTNSNGEDSSVGSDLAGLVDDLESSL